MLAMGTKVSFQIAHIPAGTGRIVGRRVLTRYIPDMDGARTLAISEFVYTILTARDPSVAGWRPQHGVIWAPAEGVVAL